VAFSKVYAPVSLFLLGLCAAFAFRRFGLGSLACVLGGLAAALNSDFFSTACWGVAAQAIAFGMNYLAIGLLTSPERRGRWVRTALAGLAVGMGVVEGADIGLFFSLFVAAFVIFQALVNEGTLPKRIGMGVGRLVFVTGLAIFIAAQAITSLISGSVKGVVGMAQDAETKAWRWDGATQWSVPKRETLGTVVAGLFGYRMDTPSGGNYWGAVGRDAAWDRYFEGGQQGPPPDPNMHFIRQTGGGGYAGVLVVLVAVWAGIQSLRKENSVFSPGNRKLIWFWLGTAAVSLLLAFGRHAPFYQYFYALPYVSIFRNPAKFGHVFQWSLVILFAYGMHGLSRRYLEIPAAKFAGLSDHLKNWWAKASPFDRKWTVASVGMIGISLLGWLIYSSYRPGLETYLQTVQFDARTASAIAGFSLRQVGWFILFLTLAVSLVTLVLSGAFAGARAKWGAILLGLLLVVDLARANLPWIIYWNYKEKYATNPVIDLLRAEPYENRVAILPQWLPLAFRVPEAVEASEQLLEQLYRIEWLQHQFLYYNVQSLDIVQMPRPPEELVAFEGAMRFRGTPDSIYLVARRWQLTNTRYLLGAAGLLDVLNQGLDPARQRFAILTRFDIVPKDGVFGPRLLEELTAAVSTNGRCALFEFKGALPRAKLYTNWQVITNDQATLQQLASVEFDPEQSVIVADALPSQAAGNMNQNAGTVEFASYAPKDIVLNVKTDAAPAVLLLNDKYDPNWQVWVDGKQETLLRCNYIMRGVYLSAGPHTVAFQFKPPVGSLYISLVAVAFGLGLCVLSLFLKDRRAATSRPARFDMGRRTL
jgi:hypothetical protein